MTRRERLREILRTFRITSGCNTERIWNVLGCFTCDSSIAAYQDSDKRYWAIVRCQDTYRGRWRETRRRTLRAAIRAALVDAIKAFQSDP